MARISVRAISWIRPISGFGDEIPHVWLEFERKAV